MIRASADERGPASHGTIRTSPDHGLIATLATWITNVEFFCTRNCPRDQTKANGVFFISGDVHFSEISKTDQPRYPLYDFTSSGITNANNIWSATINPSRVSPIPYTHPNFGLIEIDWNQPSPQITLQTIGLQGKPAFETTLSLDELTAK